MEELRKAGNRAKKSGGGTDLTGYPSIDKPWLKYYSDEECLERIPKNTLYGLIYDRNKNRLQEIALVFWGKQISYRTFFCETDKVTKSLLHMGVKRGDVVNLLVAAVPEAVYLVLACSRIGALANFINPLFSKAQIIDRINDTNSPYLFVLDKMIPIVQQVLDQTCIETVINIPVSESMPVHLKIITSLKTNYMEREVKWKKFLEVGKNETLINEEYIEDTPVVMVYSSGTTGASKGIVLTNDSIAATCVMERNSIPTLVESTFLAFIPIWFSTGISLSILVPLVHGGSVILEPSYSEKNFARDIVKMKPQGLVGTASLWEYALSKIKMCDLSFIKCPISGGEAISPDFEKRLNCFLRERNCKCTLVKGYGQCELGGTVTLSKEACEESFGDVGIPLSHVCVSTFDIDTGEEKRIGEIGEIRVLSPARMKGYYNRPEETDKKFHYDSLGRVWVCTEDAGIVREDGHIVVLGRISDSYISRGEKRIFLFNIKHVILESPLVSRCEVVKTDCAEDNVVAHIVLQKGVDETDAITSIHNMCLKKLEAEEIPTAYKIRTAFELNPTSGKVDVEALKRDDRNLIYSNTIDVT